MSVLYGEKKEVKFGIVVNRNLEFEEKVRLEFGQGTVAPYFDTNFFLSIESNEKIVLMILWM